MRRARHRFIYGLFLTLLALICAASAHSEETRKPQFARLPNLRKWRLAHQSPDTPPGVAFFYARNEIRRIERFSDLEEDDVWCKTPDNLQINYLQVQQGKVLIVLLSDGRNKKLAWRSAIDPKAKWTVSPSFEQSRGTPTSLAMDKDGRIVFTHSRSQYIDYQAEPGGAVTSYEFPLRGSGKSINRVRTHVAECGDVWLFTDFLGGANNYKGLKGLLRFKEGKISQLDTGINGHSLSAVHVAKDTIFVSYDGKAGVFVDTREAKLLEKGPFDPAPFKNQPIARWSRAPDGTIWMTTFSQYHSKAMKREETRGLYSQVWKWNGQELVLVRDGFDFRKNFSAQTSPIIALSAKAAFAGCNRGGFCYFDERGLVRLDWQCGNVIDQTSAIRVGKDFILAASQNTGRFVAVPTADPTALQLSTNKSISLSRTLAKITPDRDGRLWSIIPGPKPQFAVWNGTGWEPNFVAPHAPKGTWGFNFDSENRPWVFGNHSTPKVWIRENGEWTTYETKSKAYEKEVARFGPDLDINFIKDHPRSQPLVVNRNEIWHICEWARLHILRKGDWWTAYYEKCGNKGHWAGAPYLNKDGNPRVVQGNKVMRFIGDHLEATTETPPTPSGNRQQTIIETYRNRPILEQHRILKHFQALNGIVWTVTDKPSLVGFLGESAQSFSLAGSPALSRPITQILTSDSGALFLGLGGTSPGHEWAILELDIPHISFDVKISTDLNKVRFAISKCNVDLEQIHTRARIDNGDWLDNVTEIAPIREGEHQLSLVCRLKKGLSVSIPVVKHIVVDGDLDKTVRDLVNRLGADSYKDREQAQQDLRRSGKIAIPYLLEAISSPDPEIRVRARKLLTDLGD
jgi:hypothetical protein